MNQSIYINDLIRMESNDELEHSDVTEFYSGCNVLITDATDFVNKLVVEKLLRSCSKIGKLFILIKRKSNENYKDRLNSMFDDPLYERLRHEKSDFRSRVTLIEGDTSTSELGLSSTSRDFLQKNIHVVIHKPATTDGNVRFRQAVNVNVRAVKLMLQLAREMSNLKAFVYVSSAFSNYPNQYVNERFYNVKKSADKVLSLVDALDDNLLNCLTSKIVGKWSVDPTIFAQYLGEELIQMYGSRMPTCIVRSSIAVSTYKEPLPGYIDESHEITKILASIAIGAIRVLRIDGQCKAEIVPADYVANNILVAAWDVHRTWSTSEYVRTMGEIEPIIYNCVSSCDKPINWDSLLRLNKKFTTEEPSIKTSWYHYLIFVQQPWLYKICVKLLHLLPAAISDAMIIQPTHDNLRLVTVYEKIHKMIDTFTCFGSKQWVFGNSNVLKLRDKMNHVDRDKFDFNFIEFDWEEYMMYYTRALRVHLFKDPMSSLKQARKKYKRMKIAHYALITSISFLLLFLVLETYNFML